jgi:hypothetical protein
LYCGDPRFSDVPMMNIWRSQDNYSDHMVRQFSFSGLPLRRIDNCAFMIGKTGTCYYRAMHAWKGMLLLELARGGWMNVYHGNLELLDTADAEWFARVQRLYHPLQAMDAIKAMGAIPGTGKPYWFCGGGSAGMVYTVVNAGQEIVSVDLGLMGPARVLYADAGFKPVVAGGSLTMGSEQLVVVGTGVYGDAAHDLGTDDGVRVPVKQERLAVDFVASGRNKIAGSVKGGRGLRILFQQFGADGFPVRSWGGSPPDGKKMDQLLTIRCRQGGRDLPLVIEYDKMIWSGLSWAAGELRPGSYDATAPVEIECSCVENDLLRLEARVYAVDY